MRWILVCFFALFLPFTALAGPDEIRRDLKVAGFDDSEAEEMTMKILDIVMKGGDEKKAEDMALRLKSEGFSSGEIVIILGKTGELMDRGMSMDEAGNIVSRAAHQAKREGLRGRALAERVHEAIRAMKERHHPGRGLRKGHFKGKRRR